MSDDYLRKMSLPEFRKQYEGTFAEPEPMTEDELLQMERRHERRDDDAQRVIREVWRLRADLAAAEQRATESDARAERLAAAIRRITDVVIMEDVPPGTFRAARGVAPVGPEGLSAAEAVRRVRDAQ